jgi:hypothetical protein
MESKEQVVSIALAKQLKEVGVPQKSLFYWVTTILNNEFDLVSVDGFDTIRSDLASIYIDSGHEGEYWSVQEVYSAFTVAELGELLPRCYISWATPQNGEMKWWCRRMESHFLRHEETPIFTAATEADARAKMLLWKNE